LQWILDEIDLMQHHESTGFSRLVRNVCDLGAERTLEIYGRPAAGGALQRIPATALVEAVIDPIRRDGEAALFDLRELNAPAWVSLKFRCGNVVDAWSHLDTSSEATLWVRGTLDRLTACQPAFAVMPPAQGGVPKRGLDDAYRARIVDGRYPTRAEDEAWRREYGISRTRMRQLRQVHRPPEKKKGGHPART
jgi:hypothetical protein